MRREVSLSSGEWLPPRWPGLRGALPDGTVGVAGVLPATGPEGQAGSRVKTADRLPADAELAAYTRGIPVADAVTRVGVVPAAMPEDLRILAQTIVQYLGPFPRSHVPTFRRARRDRGYDCDDGFGPPGVDDATLPSGDPGRTIDIWPRAQKQHDTLAAALGIAARHEDMPRFGGAVPDPDRDRHRRRLCFRARMAHVSSPDMSGASQSSGRQDCCLEEPIRVSPKRSTDGTSLRSVV